MVSKIDTAWDLFLEGKTSEAKKLVEQDFSIDTCTDLAALSDEALNKALYGINHRPRKCLAYRTASEALEDESK